RRPALPREAVPAREHEQRDEDRRGEVSDARRPQQGRRDRPVRARREDLRRGARAEVVRGVLGRRPQRADRPSPRGMVERPVRVPRPDRAFEAEERAVTQRRMTFHQIALYAAIGLGFFLGSLAVVVVVLLRVPADYFTRTRRPWLEGKHPALRLTLFALKNLVGVAVVAVGIVLSIPGVPGQGLITIFIGLMLMDFPGKFRLERSIIRRPLVHEFINRLRRRYGRTPLLVP